MSVSINTGTGPQIATDIVSSQNFQIVKVMQGSSGSTGSMSTWAVTGTINNAPLAFSTFGSGRKVTTADGTAIVLGSAACYQVKMVALTSNTGTIRFGAATVVVTSGSETGVVLYQDQASDWVTVTDLNKIYINAANSGDGVAYVYLA